MAGSAASFVRVQEKRCHLKRSFGDAGVELQFLRDVWQCFQREPDRAVGIIFGSLGAYDNGDVEATTKRLWHRAVRVLREKPHFQQLKLLAGQLEKLKQMSGEEILALLRV